MASCGGKAAGWAGRQGDSLLRIGVLGSENIVPSTAPRPPEELNLQVLHVVLQLLGGSMLYLLSNLCLGFMMAPCICGADVVSATMLTVVYGWLWSVSQPKQIGSSRSDQCKWRPWRAGDAAGGPVGS